MKKNIIYIYLIIKDYSFNLLRRKSRADVPGWVLVVLMTTALVTGIWSIAAPKLTTILRNSLDAMGGIRQLRNLLRLKSRGSVESFITIIPQVIVFLIMLQLVFMQFQVIKDTYISQGKISKSAIYGTGDNFIRKPLIGGGSILLLERTNDVSKFIDISTPARKKVVAIAVDENDKN